MDKEYLKRASFYVITAIIGIVAVVYFIYHLVVAFDNDIAFDEAKLLSGNDTIVSEGYIFRTETVLRTNSEGLCESLYDEGEHVSAFSEVARVYNASSSADRMQISQIDKQIKMLSASNLTSTSVYDTKYVDKQISQMYYLICEKLACGEFEYASQKTNDLCVLLNQREIITNKRLNFNNEIAELQAQKQALSDKGTSVSEVVKTKKSGYYYSVTDGYETVFVPEMLNNITPQMFAQLAVSPPVEYTKSNGGYSAGKMVTAHEWYIVCSVDKISASKFTEANVYQVMFPYAANKTVDFTLERISSTPEDENALLILKTNVVPDGFTFTRVQNVEITYGQTKGIRIPGNALRVQEDKTGVFILEENVVRFIEVDIIFEGDGYYISKTDYPKEDTQRRLKEHDRIITRGKDLYDGMIAE